MTKAMKLETDNAQPFAHDTAYKTCLGCGEIKIPVSDKLCAECDHKRRLQVFVNAVAALGEAVSRGDDCGAILREVILDAEALVRDA